VAMPGKAAPAEPSLEQLDTVHRPATPYPVAALARTFKTLAGRSA
jgi:hypothetical protein